MIDEIQCSAVFEQIEQEFDVNSLTYGSILMWPYIRRWLRLRLAFKSHGVFDEIDLKKFRVSFDPNSLRELAPTQSIDALLYAPETIHIENFAGQRFAPYLDSMIPLLENANKSYLKLSVYKDTGETYFNPVHHLKVQQIELDESVDSITRFDEFKLYVTKFGVDDIEENYFLKCGRKCEAYAELFDKVLSILTPKVIFFSCYYTDIEGAALIMAARKLGIKTVDIQHGIIKKHPVYCHYSTVPTAGYNTMPSHYWTWGSVTSDYLEKTYNSTLKHTPFVGGNVRAMNLSRNQGGVPSSDTDRCMQTYEQTVLVVLQYPCLGEVVLDTMRLAGESVRWIVRFHPRFSSTQELDGVRKEIEEHNLSSDNILISLPSDQRIYEDLEKSDVMVAYFSTAVYEALMYQVLPVIVDPRGKALYEDEINSNAILYAEDSFELLQMITGESLNTESDCSGYVNSDPDVAQKALSDLFGA